MQEKHSDNTGLGNGEQLGGNGWLSEAGKTAVCGGLPDSPPSMGGTESTCSESAERNPRD